MCAEEARHVSALRLVRAELESARGCPVGAMFLANATLPLAFRNTSCTGPDYLRTSQLHDVSATSKLQVPSPSYNWDLFGRLGLTSETASSSSSPSIKGCCCPTQVVRPGFHTVSHYQLHELRSGSPSIYDSFPSLSLRLRLQSERGISFGIQSFTFRRIFQSRPHTPDRVLMGDYTDDPPLPFEKGSTLQQDDTPKTHDHPQRVLRAYSMSPPRLASPRPANNVPLSAQYYIYLLSVCIYAVAQGRSFELHQWHESQYPSPRRGPSFWLIQAFKRVVEIGIR